MHRQGMEVLHVARIQQLSHENENLKRNLTVAESLTNVHAMDLEIVNHRNTNLKKKNESLRQEIKALNMKISRLTKLSSGGVEGYSTCDRFENEIRSPSRKRRRVEVECSQSESNKGPSVSIDMNSSEEEPIKMTYPTKMQEINLKLMRSKKKQDLREREEGDERTSEGGIIVESGDEDATATTASPPKRLASTFEIVMDKLKSNIKKEREFEEVMNRFFSVNRNPESDSVQSSSTNEDEEKFMRVIKLVRSGNYTASESVYELGNSNKCLMSKLLETYLKHVGGNGNRLMMSSADTNSLITNEVTSQIQRPTSTAGTSSHHTHTSNGSVRIPEKNYENNSNVENEEPKNKAVNQGRRLTRSSAKVTVAVTDNSANPKESVSTSDSEQDVDDIGKILGVRQDKNGERVFLIQWKGCEKNDAIWKAEGELVGAEDMIKEFNDQGGGHGRETDQRIELWCICRQPDDNGLMICCDHCQDWFHGACVGVSSVQGKVMERKNKTWHCPPCKKLLTTKADEVFTKMKKKVSFGGGARASKSASASKRN